MPVLYRGSAGPLKVKYTHSSLFAGSHFLVSQNWRRRPKFYLFDSSVDTSICTGLRAIAQNVQGVEGGGEQFP